jgi:hypothetical protein
MPSYLRFLVTGLAAAALAACEPASSPRLVPVTLRLTDAPGGPLSPTLDAAALTEPPPEPPTIDEAVVWVSRAYLMPGTGEDGPGVTITDDPQEYDLLELQDGVTALLGQAMIPEGRYAQLRLVLDSARVTLSGGTPQVLYVPSGMQSGVKVTFPGTIAVGGDATALQVDFDVTANFRLAPPTDPVRVLFTPLLKGTVVDG